MGMAVVARYCVYLQRRHREETFVDWFLCQVTLNLLLVIFVRLWDHGVSFYVAISLVAGFDSDSDWQWFLFSSSSLSHDSSSNATD